MGCETKADIKELARLKKELAKDPKNAVNLFKMAMLLCEPFHKTEDSISYFEEAMKLDPSKPEIPFWEGYFLCVELMEYQRAKDLFEKALSIDPENSVFNYMMFSVLDELGKKEDALKFLLKSAKLQPEWLLPRKQYITFLTNNNEFYKASQELDSLETTIESRCKNKKLSAINLLEKLHWGESDSFDCKTEKENILYRKKQLVKKKKGLVKAPPETEK